MTIYARFVLINTTFKSISQILLSATMLNVYKHDFKLIYFAIFDCL